MSKKRYIPLTPKEIQLYRRERAIEESQRDDRTNNTLIALRRKNLSIINHNPQFKEKLVRFNSYVKRKEVSELVKVIQYMIRLEDGD